MARQEAARGVKGTEALEPLLEFCWHPGSHLLDTTCERFKIIRVIANDLRDPLAQARRKESTSAANERARLASAAANPSRCPARTRFQAFLADIAPACIVVAETDADRDKLAWPRTKAAQVLTDVILTTNHEFQIGAHGRGFRRWDGATGEKRSQAASATLASKDETMMKTQ